ncbi:MAG TPA: P-II family nitrogen regulator [Nitrosopumilaceae archaeon]|nr:P-II family nitrogen regulator [Nitrosopumilaceae archaeon]
MKRIEAIVRPGKVRLVLAALKDVGSRAVTVVVAKGQGKGARPLVRDNRGTTLFTAEYNAMNSIITIVDDAMVNDVISAIAKAVGEGSKASGKIFISPVEDVIDLESGRRGPSAL